jgi:hypothetical protein
MRGTFHFEDKASPSLPARVAAYVANGSAKAGMRKEAFAARLLAAAMDADLMGVYRKKPAAGGHGKA